MGRTYVIPDLHGRFDLLNLAMIRIAGDPQPGTVVTLGDYIDRGPQSRQVIELLMEGMLDPWKLIPIKGNHEDMMQQCCRGKADLGWWIGNGGGATLVSYGQQYGERPDPEVVLPSHLAWVDALPTMHVDEHRVYVHAGVDPEVPLDCQREHDLLWKRYQLHDQGGHGSRHVVHGHTPDENDPRVWEGRTNLDTLAYETGRLVVGVFENDVPGGPTDYLEILGETAR